jgi:hypothetical protein
VPIFEAPPNVKGFSAAAEVAPPTEKLGAVVVGGVGFELPPNEKLGAEDSCLAGSAGLGAALKENEGAADVVVELEPPPKEKVGAAETAGFADSVGFDEPPKENDGAASFLGAFEPPNEKEGAVTLGASSLWAAFPNEKVGAVSGFFSSAFAPPKEKDGAAGFGSSANLLPPLNEYDGAAVDEGTDWADVDGIAAEVEPKEKEGAAASFFGSSALEPNENEGVAVLVSSVFGAPKENDGAATFSSFFSVVLGAPKEKVGGAVFSVVLEAPNVKDGFGASDDGAADEVPKEKFGAAAAGAASEETFGGLGFGDSQAGHFARSAALDIMQIEQVQLPLVAFFAFDMKSENPPATGAGIGVAISAGLINELELSNTREHLPSGEPFLGSELHMPGI